MQNTNLSEQPEILEARYRLAARQIRAEARLRLLELRRERWEKRVAALGAVEPEMPVPAPEIAPMSVATPPELKPKPATVTAKPRPSFGTAIDSISDQFMVPAEIRGSVNLRPTSEDVAPPAENAPTAEPPAEPQPASDQSDLALLPGVGEGLIWLLKSAGITCLKDLSETDPAKLAGQLGVVGELLDLKDWIAFARGAVRN